MLAGPIIKYHEIKNYIENRKISLDDIDAGILRFLVGLGKKVLVADTMAGVVDKVFSAPVAELGFGDAWMGTVCFAVQIYFDFSGYSDMAIGLARTFGIQLRENFNQPYLAAGFADFWKRWHISLSSWICDYLYIPLGGNRTTPARVYVNLWICFLASGLWHGANWTFVLWGAYHGLFVSADHLILQRIWPLLPRVAGVAITFFLVITGWVFFRAKTFERALDMLAVMADPLKTSRLLDLWITDDVYIFLAAGLVASFTPLTSAKRLSEYLMPFGGAVLQRITLLAVTLWVFGRIFTASFQPFIYFRF